jgi:hypothetical protein
MSLKSSTQSRQSLDLRSLPTESEIDNAYDLAYRIVQQMRVISCYRISYSSLCSIVFAEAEGLENAVKYWRKLKDEKADALESLLLKLEMDSRQLRDRFSPLWRLFQVYAFADLGDFVYRGRKWGRWAYPAIENLAEEVQAWGRQCKSLYEIPQPQPIDSELRKVCEQQEAGFPMSFEIEADLRERLFLEQGRMIKGLLEAQALYVATKPGTKSKDRIPSEETVDQQEIEDALFQRWQAFRQKKPIPKNETKAFLDRNQDIANEYSMESFKALVDKVRKRKPKRKTNR